MRTISPFFLLFTALYWGAVNSFADMRSYTRSEPLMGTTLTVQLYAESEDLAKKSTDAAFACAYDLCKILSSHDAESELNKLNAAPLHQAFKISAQLSQVLRIAQYVAVLTDGAFDPTLGRSIRLFRLMKSRGTMPSEEQIAEAKKNSGYRHFRVIDNLFIIKDAPIQFDLGGIGKGYVMDEMGKAIRLSGVTSFCISDTSDVLVGSPPPKKKGWKVAVQSLSHTLELVDTSVSTSGDTFQRVTMNGKTYSHVISVKTGLGATISQTTTVQAPTSALADALATGLSLMTPEQQSSTLKKIQDVRIIQVLPQLNDQER